MEPIKQEGWKEALEKAVTEYSDGLRAEARDWHKGMHVGLPMQSKDIHNRVDGFVEGVEWAHGAFVQPLEKQVEEWKHNYDLAHKDFLTLAQTLHEVRAEKDKEINQLRAENTRLREALQFIAKDDDWQIYDAVDEDFKLMRQMVKATLNHKPL
jgi:hypothetical protein